MIGLEKGKFWCGAIKNSVDGGLRFREVMFLVQLREKFSVIMGSRSPHFMLVMRTGSADGCSNLALLERCLGRDKHSHDKNNVTVSFPPNT